MTDQPGNTTLIQGVLDRLKAGDDSARDELISLSMERLRRLARKMLRDNPAVRRWNETDDVFQNAMIRLNRALESVRPETTRKFVGLAATQIRRELIDLWRHHYGPEGDGAHHASDPGEADSQGRGQPMHDRGDVTHNPADVVAMHETVDSLSAELKEVFEKRVYLKMTHAEIAADMGVSTKTAKRRWSEAQLRLQEIMEQ